MSISASYYSPIVPPTVRRLSEEASRRNEWWGWWIMCVAQGDWRKSPNLTHRWNVQRLTPGEVKYLERFRSHMVAAVGEPPMLPRWLGPLPLFHMPLLWPVAQYGFKVLRGKDYHEWEYVVVCPDMLDVLWHPGWIAPDTAGVTRLSTIMGPVRLLVGPGTTHFFGLDHTDRVMRLRVMGGGKLGYVTPE